MVRISFVAGRNACMEVWLKGGISELTDTLNSLWADARFSPLKTLPSRSMEKGLDLSDLPTIFEYR